MGVTLYRLPDGRMLPDLIRDPAATRTTAHGGLTPLAAWCRASVLMALQNPEGPAGACLPEPRQRRLRRRAGGTLRMRACFLGAAVLIGSASRLYEVGLLRNRGVSQLLDWSSRLAAVGMRLWREGRS
jgi:hypothetical protein